MVIWRKDYTTLDQMVDMNDYFLINIIKIQRCHIDINVKLLNIIIILEKQKYTFLSCPG